MVKHWIFVTKPKNFEICKRYGVYGADERYKTVIEKHLEAGNMGLFYVTVDKTFNGPWRTKSRGQYAPNHPAVEKWEPSNKYTYVIPVELETRKCPLEKVFNKLLFITNRKKRKGGYTDHFQFSIISIREEDYEMIISNMK